MLVLARVSSSMQPAGTMVASKKPLWVQ